MDLTVINRSHGMYGSTYGRIRSSIDENIDGNIYGSVHVEMRSPNQNRN